jgi:hypothetical protein
MGFKSRSFRSIWLTPIWCLSIGPMSRLHLKNISVQVARRLRLLKEIFRNAGQ